MMNDVRPLDRETAEKYAAWFKALADGTRVQVVSLLARRGTPMTVKEIVAAVPVGQSTAVPHACTGSTRTACSASPLPPTW